MLEGGKIFGKVPYLLLKLHEGNGTYFYDRYAFSCMNFYEFSSDAWISFFYEHHFNGFLLGRVPLLKKLNWREVFVFKGVYGTLSARNDGSLPNTKAVMLFPVGMSSVEHPYLETGSASRTSSVCCAWISFGGSHTTAPSPDCRSRPSRSISVLTSNFRCIYTFLACHFGYVASKLPSEKRIHIGERNYGCGHRSANKQPPDRMLRSSETAH